MTDLIPAQKLNLSAQRIPGSPAEQATVYRVSYVHTDED